MLLLLWTQHRARWLVLTLMTLEAFINRQIEQLINDGKLQGTRFGELRNKLEGMGFEIKDGDDTFASDCLEIRA